MDDSRDTRESECLTFAMVTPDTMSTFRSDYSRTDARGLIREDLDRVFETWCYPR